MIERAFWRNRRVLLTGHTGFKGAWLSLWLEELGADVVGLALPPDTEPALYSLVAPVMGLRSRVGDIRDPVIVAEVVAQARPQIVIHMAAQALVRRSYRLPVETFSTNVLGTALLLDRLRAVDGLQAVLVITTDKVYHHDGDAHPFAEHDRLGGADPYSASKAAAELITASMGASFLTKAGVAVATARAGNVIGGGDWSEDRLIPDIWRAVTAGEPLRLRHPHATRPWQHVLEPLAGYMRYAERLAGGADPPRTLNFGPPPGDVASVADVADAMLDAMHAKIRWIPDGGDQPEEAQHLTLDPTLAKRSLGWRPRLDARQAVQWTADWYRAVASGTPARTVTLDQIARYEALL